MANFTTLDIIIVIAYLLTLIVVGIWTAKKTKTTEDFMVAGRNIGIWRFTAAMAACVIGGALTTGGATLGYNFGISALWLGGIFAVSIFLLSLLLRTKLTNMRILSACEGFGVFYGPQARLLSSLVMVVYLFMVAVVQVVAAGTIMNVMFGWSLQVSMLIGGLVVLLYVVIGGMWAVTYTDIIQFLIMTVGVIIICPVMAIHGIGGFGTFIESVPATHWDITSIGAPKIIAYILLYTPGFLVGQDIWQRAFTAKSPKVARRGTMMAAAYIFIYALAITVLGMCLYIAMPNMEDPTLAFATATTTFTPTGVRGVLLAAALAAVMSTASSEIMGTATVIFNDLILGGNKNYSEKKGVLITRGLAIVTGLVAIVCALWIQSVLVALDVAYAFLSGCIFVPLVFAFLLKKVSAKAGLLSLLGSFITVVIFMIKDGMAATTPIMYGILVSAVIFFVVNAVDKKKHQVEIMEDGTVIVDGVKQELKQRNSAGKL
ncbi:MAG: sodium:solute symporter [Firmicutes bacterium]|nr:sodium:solute symporter [Bacillota bacterium]